MKVLFVSSGNNPQNGPSPVVRNQGESLLKEGVEVEYYSIRGKGAKGYLKNVMPLRRVLRKGKFDVVHAHYADSAALTTVAGARNLVVSLMGTDALHSKFSRFLIRLFSPFWKLIIVKSVQMKEQSGLKQAVVLPNGVNLDTFPPMEKMHAKKAAGWSLQKKQVLFLANPQRVEKNYSLAEKSVKELKEPNVELKVVFDIKHSETTLYFHAADVLLMTSLHEGSPNVIKEGMACGIPIICTNVGDVPTLLKEVKGCHVTSFDHTEISRCLREALQFEGLTDGRQALINKGLTADHIAKRLKSLYSQL